MELPNLSNGKLWPLGISERGCPARIKGADNAGLLKDRAIQFSALAEGTQPVLPNPNGACCGPHN